MANIKILVGTVYGNALDVAEMCQEQLTQKGHSAKVLRESTIEDLTADDTDVVLVCTSTTGQGEIPDSLLLLYCQLQDQRPPLSDVKYGLIGLGDSSYDTFAEAGRLVDGLFQELKMQRVGEPLIIDACESMAPCEDAEPWVLAWSDQLG